jgi:hypothetical protein
LAGVDHVRQGGRLLNCSRGAANLYGVIITSSFEWRRAQIS